MVFNKSNGFYKSNTTKIVHEDLIDYLCRNFVFKVDLEQLKVSKFLILKQSKMLLLEILPAWRLWVYFLPPLCLVASLF